MTTFRVALALGGATVLALGVVRLFPVAVIAGAVLVPLLTLIYLVDVDVYEDEPFRVLALTALWGAVAGVGLGILGRELAPSDIGSLLESTTSRTLVRGIALPVLAAALMLAGPLVLLPHRKFNDVLDGATFGAVSGVTLFGAQVITQSSSFLGSGLRPVGATAPWVLRLAALALAMPVIAAGVGGAVAGAFWLRYRAPAVDRRALGVLGRPLSAATVAGGMLVAAAMAQLFLSKGQSLLVLVTLAGAALLWLRQLIHLGLLEEEAEVELGDTIVCANCDEQTRRHSFCAFCGVSHRALPKGRCKDVRSPGDKE